jgi:hypothetical protein
MQILKQCTALLYASFLTIQIKNNKNDPKFCLTFQDHDEDRPLFY